MERNDRRVFQKESDQHRKNIREIWKNLRRFLEKLQRFSRNLRRFFWNVGDIVFGRRGVKFVKAKSAKSQGRRARHTRVRKSPYEGGQNEQENER